MLHIGYDLSWKFYSFLRTRTKKHMGDPKTYNYLIIHYVQISSFHFTRYGSTCEGVREMICYCRKRCLSSGKRFYNTYFSKA